MAATFTTTTSALRTVARRRGSRPMLESLEDRLLLYSTLGAQFVHGSRITFSFVPDGTSIGGTPSVLFQTLNAKFPTATWQLQFQKAAAVWQAVANINLSLVGDDGSPLGVDGYQQGDSRFGDIRISAIPQASGTLATAFLPPPINGGTDAGDIILNSNVTWQINSTYDLQTVAIHEIGHALGMGHSTITYAVMYATYNGIKQSLNSDDVAGIQSVWQAPQPDQFNSGGQNNGTYSKAANITSYIDASAQISIPSLRLQSGSQSEWFSVTVPSSTTGTMVAKVQSSDLSLLSPRVSVYTANLQHLGTTTTTNYGGTVSVSVAGVQPGQTYLIRANGNTSGHPSGGFGLQMNFGSAYQPPIAPPYTTVPSQPNQGGGSISMELIQIGDHVGYGETLYLAPRFNPRPPGVVPLPGGVFVAMGVLEFGSASSPVRVEPPLYVPMAVLQQAEPVVVEDTPVLQAVDSVLSAWEADDQDSLLVGWDAADEQSVEV